MLEARKTNVWSLPTTLQLVVRKIKRRQDSTGS
jgi:hypothetical protein